MDNVIKIGIYAGIILLATIWVSSTIKSCNNKSEDEVTAVLSADISEESFFEDGASTEEYNYESDMGGGTFEDSFEETYPNNDLENDYTSLDEMSYGTVSETKKSVSMNEIAPNNNGKYMVLAGSYLIENNANNMVKKLKNLGYSNAQIVIFDMSQYHSVCAARLMSYQEALQISDNLKRNGIDVYVHTKQ